MKRSLLFGTTALLLTAASSQTVIIDEDFDTYTEGSGMSVNDPANWAIWSGGADQVVSTAHALSGTQGLACISTSAANGGPGDQLLLLGDQTAGRFALTWSMYIPSGKGGYFNIQHAEDVGTPSFAAEVIFADTVVTVTANNADATGTFPYDAWFSVVV
ncbi:MAG TPA: hypothetical protein PK760_07675, partial [Flavobacteriales bacterium]|nr:hypothetical protein [Flavobacteriales bacterium]